jgi:hypothetical protein
VKTLWLLPIFLAVAAVVGYLVISGSLAIPSGQSAAIAPPVSQKEINKEKTQPAAGEVKGNEPKTSGVKSITVRLTNDGFDGAPIYRLNLKQNDPVKITIKYEDTLGDFHPIFISGCEVAFPAVNPQNKESTMDVSCPPGKYAMYCLNPNCKTHDKLNGIITVGPG